MEKHGRNPKRVSAKRKGARGGILKDSRQQIRLNFSRQIVFGVEIVTNLINI
jgi:hypothetical protein